MSTSYCMKINFSSNDVKQMTILWKLLGVEVLLHGHMVSRPLKET